MSTRHRPHGDPEPGGPRDPEPGPPSYDPVEWHRLDPRSAIATGIGLVGVGGVAGIPTVIGVVGDGGSAASVVAVVAAIGLAIVVVGVVADLVRVRRTTYRVGEDRFEVLTAIIGRRRRTLPRDRIRVVDLTADPLSRLLGLVTVKVSTGDPGSAPVTLWALRAPTARRLRATLLERRAPEGDADDVGSDGAPEPDVLAVVRPPWLGYGALSVTTPALGFAAFGGLLSVSSWVGLQDDVVSTAAAQALALGLALATVLGVLAFVVVGAVAALALHVEMWWAHRLTRAADGMLRVQRGLLTTRSVSIEERRVRGVELVEPWTVRQAGGARVDVLVTGMGVTAETRKSQDSTVLPTAPRAVAVDVAASVLRSRALESTTLRPHPRAALHRLRVRALAALVATVAVVALVGVVAPWVPGVAVNVVVGVLVVLGTPAALLVAGALYRAMGHGVGAGHLVVRTGWARRSTTVLELDAAIGVTVRSTPFQRRVGLATLVVATAAGSGRVRVRDVGAADAVAIAAAVRPETLAAFLADADADARQSAVTGAGSGSSTSPPPPADRPGR